MPAIGCIPPPSPLICRQTRLTRARPPDIRGRMPDGVASDTICRAADDATAADRLFAAVGELILSGAIEQGAKISEPDLAARFGTSRAPLREALRRLEERKLVTRIAHQGARVTRLCPERIAEIYQVREALEGIAAREAARHMPEAAIAELRRLLDLHEARVTAHDVYRQGSEDDDFHFRIIRGSGNQMLIRLLLDEYYLLIRLLRRKLSRPGGLAQRALVEHRRVLDAIAERDPELAEAMMRRHIAAAFDRLRQAMVVPNPAPRPRKEDKA